MTLLFGVSAAAMCALVLAILIPRPRIRAAASGEPVPETPVPPRQGDLWVWLLAVPVLAAGIYARVGHPEVAAAQAQAQAQRAAGPAAPATADDLNALQARTRAHPQDAQAWQALAHAQEAVRDFPAAVQSYRRLNALQPGDVTVLSNFAVALAMTQEDHPGPEPEALLQQALALQPENVETLALLGSLRYARHDYAGAVAAWEPILSRVSADSPVAASLSDNIARARALAGAPRRP